jgi:serine-type D-Ala-D-Ala carboxypeptidase
LNSPDPVDRLMELGLADDVFPGAALICAVGGEVVLHRTYGLARREGGALLLTPDTRFDLASVSKALATSVAVMFATEEGLVRLDEPLGHTLPLGAPLADLTPWHLLSHCSGLPAWLPLHERAGAVRLQKAPTDQRRTWMRRQVAQTPLDYLPGSRSVYSDLGFMVLEWLLESRTRERLDGYLRQRFHEPLGLRHTGYVDLEGPPDESGALIPFAATERCPWRKRVIQGEVHDHLTWFMGGVCGQAGLFSTAWEVHRMLADLWKSWQSTGGILATDTVRRFWQPAGVPGSCFRLGWDGPSPSGYSAAGRLMDRAAVGHLGFTGCDFWLDPARGYWVVLLTNRVHPRTDNRRIARFRPALHDLLARFLRL